MAESTSAAADISAEAPPQYEYKAEDFIPPLVKNEQDRRSVSLTQSYGLDSHRRTNFFCLQENTLMFAVGNILHFLDTESMDKQYFPLYRQGAIGAIAVHPNGKFIAVGEKSVENPNIYVYRYPSMEIHRVLKQGTLRSYAALSFNTRGDRLASVGGDPDYMLTIWDWSSEAIILRSKAFSQDVYTIAFHPQLDGMLTSSGMGHIKFWKMARTFTGLKLQGAVGKFGLSELSDINAYIQLPDGKVLSGTETGLLLLWEGGAIKCELAIKGEGLCHKGAVDVILLEKNEVITGGDDGYVRIWDLETIDRADLVQAANGKVERVYELEPQEEILIGKYAKIKAIVRVPNSTSTFYIQDGNGHIYTMNKDTRTSEKIYHFCAGTAAAMETSPVLPRFSTLGGDGALRLYDYTSSRILGRVRLPAAGTCGQYLPAVLDNTGSTFLGGFADGVVRILRHSSITSGTANFSLLFALKPHSSPITTLSLSPDGRFLITGAEDKSIFLFRFLSKSADDANNAELLQNPSVNYCIKPIGYVELSGPLQSIHWAPMDTDRAGGDLRAKTRRKFLVVLRNGTLCEAMTPNLEDLDTEISYALTHRNFGIKDLTLDFTDDITRAEAVGEAACKALAEEAAKKEEENPGENEEQVSSSFLNKDNWKITFARKGGLGAGFNAVSAMFIDSNHFFLSMESESGEGQLRVCHISNPRVSRLVYRNKAIISMLKLSNSGKYLLYGTRSGALYSQTFAPETFSIPNNWKQGHQDSISPKISLPSQQTSTTKGPLHEMGPFWQCQAHDTDRGAIRGVSNSFDDSHLVSVGQDGSVFVWKVSAVSPKSPSLTEKDLAASDGKLKTVPDISDKATYSIQEAKIKTETDREAVAAEETKKKVRKDIAQLRDRFAACLRDWKMTPAYSESKRWEIFINQGLKEHYEKTTEERLQVIRKEAEWISERDSIAVEKLKNKFVGNVSTERIIVRAFTNKHSVSTFRTSKLIQKLEQAVNDAIATETLGENQASPPDGNLDEAQRQEIRNNTDASNERKKANEARNKLEARKMLRQERAGQLKQLIAAKPDEKYEDPNDVAAIRSAESKMGDYKLKSSSNYIVPESERVNTEKKMKQFYMVRDSIQILKENFNTFVLQLRERKQTMVADINEWNRQIATINEELKQLGVEIQGSIWQPTIGDESHPEKRYIVTEQDVAKYQRMDSERQQKLKMGDEDPLGGFNANRAKAIRDAALANAAADAAAIADKREEDVKPYPAEMTSLEMASPFSMASVDHSGVRIEEGVRTENGITVKLSELEKAELKKRVTVLKYRKERILKKVDSAVKDFDLTVSRLATEHMLLEGDMKSAEIKLLLVFREWILLKEFEHLDNELSGKLNVRMHEKKEVDQKLKDCQDKLNARRAEVDAIIEREKLIKEELTKALGENNKYEDLFTKIFRRKIRRTRKKMKRSADNADGEQEEEYSDSEDDDDMGSDFSDVEEAFDESCPAGADKSIYNQVLALREKRLDEEEQLSSIQKVIDILKKECDALLKKDRTMETALRQCEKEIQEFHSMKQQKLNELPMCIPLRLHQIQMIQDGNMAQDLSGAIVFLSSGLQRLRDRIVDLQQEKLDIRKQHKELKRMHVNLIRSRKEKQQHQLELEERLVQVQMLKFGRTVDLEKLEKMGFNKTADELREKLLKEDARRAKELAAWDKKILDAKDEYNNLLIRNTELLEGLVQKTELRKQLESTLNAKQSAVKVEFNTKSRDDEDHERLEKLAKAQREEIQKLSAEIDTLSHKSNKAVAVYSLSPALASEPQVEAKSQNYKIASSKLNAKGSLGSLMVNTKHTSSGSLDKTPRTHHPEAVGHLAKPPSSHVSKKSAVESNAIQVQGRPVSSKTQRGGQK